MKIYNTLTRKIEQFRPIHKTWVGLYTCGPTVYNYAQIGNLRTYIFEDVLQRVLEYNNFRVKRVMNVTDVGHLTSDADLGEDKIEREAEKEEKSVWDVARFYTEAFLKDIAALNIKKPPHIAPATRFVPEQIKLIEKLFEKGFAYETSKAIYFNVSQFKDYAKLSRKKLQEQKIAAREGVFTDKEKQNPADFVLWFKLVDHFKNHIMRWRSPWGEGFPGWHIECSAISRAFLGQPFDIHTGGIDHIPTHHTNEIAQSEAAYGKPLAHYWMHGEFLIVNQERMGKSMGNFITLDELIKKKYNPLAYRYLVLTAHYRSPLNFTWESLQSAEAAYQGLINKIRALITPPLTHSTLKKSPTSEKRMLRLLSTFENKFKKTINNDLDSPRTLALLHGLLDELSILYKNINLSQTARNSIKKTVKIADRVLGFRFSVAANEKIPPKIHALLKERELCRANKQFIRSDDLRKKIKDLGYEIEDTPHGPFLKKNK